MALIQGPGSTLMGLVCVTVLGTAVLAAAEASQLGMGSATDLNYNGKKQPGPVSWFFSLTILWIVGYPRYLYWRSKYGRKNLAVGGIILALVFTGTAAFVGSAWDQRRQELLAALGLPQQQAAALTSRPSVAQPSAVAVSVPVSAAAKPALEILEESGAPNQYGFVCISGRLRNNSGQAVSFVSVHYSLYDSEGAQVGEAVDILQMLEPYGVWKFSACSLSAEGAARFKLSEVTHL